MDRATKWSLASWKERHEQGYFPNSDQHRDWKVYKEVPDWLASRVRSTDNCLEIGCGYGEWMIPLSPTVNYIHGIDIHPGLVNKASELFDKHKVYNCSVYMNDGVSIPFGDKDFSFIYSISVFQHLPRVMVQGYLEESVRVAKPGATILHHFRNADNVGPYPPLSKDIKENHTGDFSVGWTKKEIIAAGKKAGLKPKVIDDGLFLLMLAKV